LNEKHPLDQAAERKLRDDAIRENGEEEEELQKTFDDKVAAFDNALDTEIERLGTEWAKKTADDVAAATARDDDTVFEVCTRIERDPETPGEFKVETVHHGDAADAANTIQRLMETQQLQMNRYLR